MFAVIYQTYVKPEYETEYQILWQEIATYFIQYCGALGSCLHKTEEGLWLAYSRWPDKKTRDTFWPQDNSPSTHLPESIRQTILKIKACADSTHSLPEIRMQLVNDLLSKI